MSSSDDSNKGEKQIDVVFTKAEVDVSSEEPPMDEWSSLIFEKPEENRKRILYAEGLYEPDSGEICTKYITMSDSAILRHPYYNYPGVLDPGIQEALLMPEPKIIYPHDGQDLYMALCKEMNICPIKIFHKGLLDETINLRYYGINPVGIRAMAMSLRLNTIVKELDLTDNWLNDDACYHLGQMLLDNVTLEKLNMSGCRIGPDGSRQFFCALPQNKSLRKLDISRNQIGDTGAEYLAKAIFQGADVKVMNLSYNNLGGKAASVLAEAFECQNEITHLDLSWNNFYQPGTLAMLTRLSENKYLQELNLSWNGIRAGGGIKVILTAPSLRELILSNNKLGTDAINIIGNTLSKAKKLITLDLSYNPMTIDDAFKLLARFRSNTIKLQQLILNNVLVSPSFLQEKEDILKLKFRKKFVVTHGDVVGGFIPKGPDARDLVLQRADFLAKKPKKNPVDVALFVLALVKDVGLEPMTIKDLLYEIKKRSGPQLDNDLIEEIANVFPGPSTPKSKTIDLKAMIDYFKRKWPERQLPPTPPPEPEPEPTKKKKKK